MKLDIISHYVSLSIQHNECNECLLSLQENPYNVRYIHTVLITHTYFAPQAVDNV